MPTTPLPYVVNSLLKAAEWPGVKPNVPRAANVGNIISFYYIGQRNRPIHDTYPFVLVTDEYSDAIRGVNLNYLDSPTVTKVILTELDNPNISYQQLRGSQGEYVVDAFRTYKHAGISQLRVYDSKFLRALAYVAPRLDPMEITQIEQQIEMLKEAALKQPVAGET